MAKNTVAAVKPEPAPTAAEVIASVGPNYSTCKNCGEEVKYPNFECKAQPGNHVVDMKEYFHLGAGHIHPVENRRAFTPYIILLPVFNKVNPSTQEPYMTKGCSIEMPMGRANTDDPEKQYYLDRKQPDIVAGPEGLAKWKAMYMTMEQQLHEQKSELQRLTSQIAAAQRSASTSNDLLAQTQQLVQG